MWNNDFAGVPIVDKTKQRRPTVTQTELEEILTGVKDRYHVLFALLAGTGLRIGEALGLKTTDFGPDCRVLHVNRSIWGGQEQAPKTSSAIRAIDLPQPLEDTTGHDRTGSLLGVVDRGRDKLAVFHLCRSNDEVVDSLNAIRRSLVSNPRPITVDSVGSHIRVARYDLPASGRRCWIRLVNNESLREIAFSIVIPYAKCECYVGPIGSDRCVIALEAGLGVTPWCIVLRGRHADEAKD